MSELKKYVVATVNTATDPPSLEKIYGPGTDDYVEAWMAAGQRKETLPGVYIVIDRETATIAGFG